MFLPEPTYHGNASYDLWLLMRLLYTTFVLRLWFVVPFAAILIWEFYLRHEQHIRGFFILERSHPPREDRSAEPGRVTGPLPSVKARKAVA